MDWILKFWNQMGVFLVDRLGADRLGKGKPELQQELLTLSGGRKSAIRDYYIKKMQIFILILTAGILISVAGLILYMRSGNEIVLQQLGRPGYGEGDRKEELTVQIEGEEKEQKLEITVQDRKYTESEKKKLLGHALEELIECLPGKNDSLDEVREDLCFPDMLEEGAVKVDWMTMPYGIINEEGKIVNAEKKEGTLVEIRATLNCQESEEIYSVYARVFPQKLSALEQLRQAVQMEVRNADDKERSEESLTLPVQMNGKQLIWSKEMINPFPALLILTVVVSLFVYLQMDQNVHKRSEERKNRLILEYPDLMWKMTMLLGAGLSIRGTFFRISDEYLREKSAARRKKVKVRICFVYEEVVHTCYEMQSGVSEGQAYERFGRRCQLPEYIRLGTVLSQNLKKGAKGLTGLLASEAETSLNDRKNHARKISEQAGTKLLLPMVLMLLIVLVVLMVPAFLSF